MAEDGNVNGVRGGDPDHEQGEQHGLHLLGGLVALGRTIAKAFGGLALPQLRLSVELCTTYWHFLLLVWLILFGLLSGSADDFLKICRQVLG